MKFPVKCACGVCIEWAMLEFQGEIEPQDSNVLLNNLDVGTLCKVSEKKIKLTCGYHEVEGSLVDLKKPIAILKKRLKQNAEALDTEVICEAFDIVGVVRKKYMFKHRPKALISKPEATKKQRRATTTPFTTKMQSA
mmetsp:Transcript_13351/g.18242  ORF Transcript_13351/g.18242 Transcript_13351/m.18242 type:complete len:137 (+) Transcript_13351:168-578(+)